MTRRVAVLARAALGATVVVVVVVVVGVTAAPSWADGAADVRKAEAQIGAASKRADALANQLNAAESRAARLSAQGEQAQQQLDEVEARTRRASEAIRRAAVLDYTNENIHRFTTDDPALEARRRAYTASARGTSTDALDGWKAAKAELADARARLTRALSAQQGQAKALDRNRAAVLAQLGQLDKALSGAKGRAAQEAARAVQARRARAASAGSSVGPILGGGGSWQCPVAGPHTFSSDFGAPRYGGGFHRHQGNDIIAARGVPVVANVSGRFAHRNNGLGGLSYNLYGDDGVTYYGAHLDHFAGVGEGHVAIGTVIGFVGNSGDARGGITHLHFEVHPGGGGAVNPYPTLVRYC
jgi:murein DD-endopeptidase MepM/ murein hydrolase activator NlpD